jgi:hypothetical protein
MYMAYYVEVKAAQGKAKSVHCSFTKEWESPAFEPCEFDSLEEATMFFNDCIEIEGDGRFHSYGIRKAGESVPFKVWNP